MIFLLIAILFALLYMAIQFNYILHWKKINPVDLPKDYTPATGVSIIVVARNESEHIKACITGLLAQQYPSHLLEVYVIDDHSTDDTLQKSLSLHDPRLTTLQLKDYPEYIKLPAFKKSAITLGVDKARFDVIVVTDADCLHQRNWLAAVVYSFEKTGSQFQTAPVQLIPGHSLLQQMQETEQLVLMLITGAGIQSGLHSIANGANMAFRKAAFQSVHGYEGNYEYASGDDMFLIEKMTTAYPGKINFAKSREAVVLTPGKSNWTDLIKQRMRWASKNKGLKNKSISLAWLFVGLYHFTMVLFLFLALFHTIRWEPFLVLLSFKWVADYFLLQQAASFFHRVSVLRNFILLQFLYSWYILRLTLSILFNKKSDWVR
jgi:cellulose synthase/poly-beta-1,6-N-acetylglucosamine synthase-like glycosyltransferase